jgi:hypothetical protein
LTGPVLRAFSLSGSPPPGLEGTIPLPDGRRLSYGEFGYAHTAGRRPPDVIHNAGPRRPSIRAITAHRALPPTGVTVGSTSAPGVVGLPRVKG